VAQWYEQNWRSKYVPWVEGGPSLYKKFGTIEAMMIERQQLDAQPSSAETIAGLFNGSRVLAEAFESDVLGRARELDLGRIADPDLASALGGLYREVVAARRGVDSSELPGPLDVLRRYVCWLGEKDWRMTTRVLRMDSPAFQQWRRDEAALHPRGLDPLTGGS
jgi:hypothetical protein